MPVVLKYHLPWHRQIPCIREPRIKVDRIDAVLCAHSNSFQTVSLFKMSGSREGYGFWTTGSQVR